MWVWGSRVNRGWRLNVELWVICKEAGSTHLWMDTDGFRVLSIVNNATMNREMQISLRDPVFISFGYTLRSGISGSYASYFFFNFWGTLILFVTIFPDSIYMQWYMILFFFFWLTSLCMTDSGSISIPTNDPVLLLFMAERYSIVCMYHIFSRCSFVEGHSGYFYVLAIINNAVMNAGVHMFFKITVFSEYMPSCGIAGGWDGLGE